MSFICNVHTLISYVSLQVVFLLVIACQLFYQYIYVKKGYNKNLQGAKDNIFVLEDITSYAYLVLFMKNMLPCIDDFHVSKMSPNFYS